MLLRRVRAVSQQTLANRIATGIHRYRLRPTQADHLDRSPPKSVLVRRTQAETFRSKTPSRTGPRTGSCPLWTGPPQSKNVSALPTKAEDIGFRSGCTAPPSVHPSRI